VIVTPLSLPKKDPPHSALDKRTDDIASFYHTQEDSSVPNSPPSFLSFQPKTKVGKWKPKVKARREFPLFNRKEFVEGGGDNGTDKEKEPEVNKIFQDGF